jgi:transposase
MVSTSVILAIDLGKFKSVLCFYDVSSKKTSFRTLVSDPGEFRKIFKELKDTTVVIEACSPAGWVHDLAVEVGLPVLVANTNAEAWAWKNVKRKTDKDDALKLARLLGDVEGWRVVERTADGHRVGAPFRLNSPPRWPSAFVCVQGDMLGG